MSHTKTAPQKAKKTSSSLSLSLQRVVFDEISSSIQSDKDGFPIEGISQETFLEVSTSISGTLGQQDEKADAFVALNVRVMVEAKSKDDGNEGTLFTSQVSAVGFYSIDKSISNTTLSQAIESRSDALIPYFNMIHALVIQELTHSIQLMGLPPPSLPFSLDEGYLKKMKE